MTVALFGVVHRRSGHRAIGVGRTFGLVRLGRLSVGVLRVHSFSSTMAGPGSEARGLPLGDGSVEPLGDHGGRGPVVPDTEERTRDPRRSRPASSRRSVMQVVARSDRTLCRSRSSGDGGCRAPAWGLPSVITVRTGRGAPRASSTASRPPRLQPTRLTRRPLASTSSATRRCSECTVSRPQTPVDPPLMMRVERSRWRFGTDSDGVRGWDTHGS